MLIDQWTGGRTNIFLRAALSHRSLLRIHQETRKLEKNDVKRRDASSRAQSRYSCLRLLSDDFTLSCRGRGKLRFPAGFVHARAACLHARPVCWRCDLDALVPPQFLVYVYLCGKIVRKDCMKGSRDGSRYFICYYVNIFDIITNTFYAR